MEIGTIAEEIIAGRRLRRGEDLSFLVTCDLEELCEAADAVRRALCGDRVELCSIVNGRSGHCGEDCKFCAQSAHHGADCEVYDLMDRERLLAACMENAAGGVDRFAIVTSGRALSGDDFEHAAEAFAEMKERCAIDLCASFGLLTDEQFARLREAGVTRYHENLETSRRFFPEICTTHTYEDKVAAIRRARAAGMEVCSGGIMGMGETWEDRIDMALELQELGVGSIPINILMPIPGTPLADRSPLEEKEIHRCMAVFRLINPEAQIRMAGGRSLMPANGRDAFACGVSATITGNMLTTSGSTIRSDREMLKELGRSCKPAGTDSGTDKTL